MGRGGGGSNGGEGPRQQRDYSDHASPSRFATAVAAHHIPSAEEGSFLQSSEFCDRIFRDEGPNRHRRAIRPSCFLVSLPPFEMNRDIHQCFRLVVGKAHILLSQQRSCAQLVQRVQTSFESFLSEKVTGLQR
jgi:hypothetical protein